MASPETHTHSPAPQETKKGLSGGAKLGIGCGVLVIIAVIGIAVAVVAGVKIAKRRLDDLTAEYKAMGFDETVQGQKLTVRNDITKPTLLLGQLVQVYGNCSTSLAVVAQVAEIHGNIEGTLHFKGQVLRVMPTSTIKNGADVIAQSFVNEGKIEGEISQTTQVSSTPSAN